MTDPVDDQKDPITPAGLRLAADWLDIYDKMALAYLNTAEAKLHYNAVTREKALHAVAGKSIQRDLRRWADEMQEVLDKGAWS